MTAAPQSIQPITIDDRTIRARKFASQIMAIIGDCVSDKDGAASRLIDAAYQTDAQITTAAAPPSTETPRRTATPWRVFTNPDGTKLVGIGTQDGEGILDCGFGVWAWDDPAGIANANLVVTAVNSHASLTAKVAELVTELRKLAIKQHIRMASGGGHVNNGRSCAVCMGAWEDHAPEFHAVTCPLFDSAALDNADGGRG